MAKQSVSLNATMMSMAKYLKVAIKVIRAVKDTTSMRTVSNPIFLPLSCLNIITRNSTAIFGNGATLTISTFFVHTESYIEGNTARLVD